MLITLYHSILVEPEVKGRSENEFQSIHCYYCTYCGCSGQRPASGGLFSNVINNNK